MGSSNRFELVLLERPYKNYDSNEVEIYSNSIRLATHLCVNEVQAVIGPKTSYTRSPYYIEFHCNGESEYHKFEVSRYISKLKPALTYFKGDVVKFRTQYSSEVPYDERRQILLRGFYFTPKERPTIIPDPRLNITLRPHQRRLNAPYLGYETNPKTFIQDSNLERTFSQMESMLDQTVNDVADWTRPTTKPTEEKNEKKSMRSLYHFQYSENNNKENRADSERHSYPQTPTTLFTKIQPVSYVAPTNDKKRGEIQYKDIKVPGAPSKPIVVPSVICTNCNKRKPIGVAYEFSIKEPGDSKKTKTTSAVGFEAKPYIDRLFRTVGNGYSERPDINVDGKAYVIERNDRGAKGKSVAAAFEGRMDGTGVGGKRMTNDFRCKSYVSEIQANQGNIAVKIRDEKLAYESFMKSGNNTKHVRFNAECERYEYN